jgi:acetyl-CoA/propionyl-CoA carboxylase carboxyl transferase subunit
MGASGAVEIIHRKTLKNSQNKDALKKRLVEEYREKFSNPYTAASRGYIDSVIRPFESRAAIYESLVFLSSKKSEFPDKKHGNMPL